MMFFSFIGCLHDADPLFLCTVALLPIALSLGILLTEEYAIRRLKEHMSLTSSRPHA